MSFKNKVVLVTGAASGIGAATALSFDVEEADLIIVDKNLEGLNEVAIKCKLKPLVLQADISNEAATKNIIDKTIENFKKLDVLVNCAGILRKGGIYDEKILEHYDDIMQNNLRSLVHITSLAVPYLVKTKGNIVNISSIAGICHVGTNYLMYGLSKAASNSFTKGIAMELASSGVRVNAVNPGCVQTNLFTNNGIEGQSWEALAKFAPLNRVLDPEEVANLIVYLASDKAKGITGSLYVIDNGMLLQSG